jgi:hypothetical protein
VRATASPAEGGEFSAVPERPQIVRGEPLILRISLGNPSDGKVLIAMEPSWIERVTSAADGRSVRGPAQRPGENPLVFSIAIEPHEFREIRVAAVETALLQEPGPYTMSVRMKALHGVATVQFVVLPYDASALEMRASELANQVVRQNDLEAEKALESMPGNIAEPYICNVLKTDAVALSSGVPRLEELGTPESVSCLVDLLPAYTGPYRLLLANALRRVEKSVNLELKMKIDAALDGK